MKPPTVIFVSLPPGCGRTGGIASFQPSCFFRSEFSLASPYPEFEDITKDVYYEVDEFTEAGRTGRHFFND